MVMRGAMSQTAIGLAIGIPAVLLCRRSLESQLFEIKSVTIAVMLVAIFSLAPASLLAGMIPGNQRRSYGARRDSARRIKFGSNPGGPGSASEHRG